MEKTVGVFIPNSGRKDVAASWTETLNACGEDVRLCKSLICEAASMNQEPNTISGWVSFGQRRGQVD